MATYKEYNVKSGTKWSVRGYIGIDETTGAQLEFNKRGFKTKKEAQAAYTRAKNDYFNHDYEKERKENHSFEEVYQEWFNLYILDVKESTARKTKEYFDLHILPTIGKMRIAKINTNTLQSLVLDWHTKLVVYKRIFNYLENVFSFALEQGYIKSDPSSIVRIPKKSKVKPKKKTKDFYSRAELENFLTVLEREEESIRWYTAFRLLAFTGIRRGELLALTWNDINFKDKLLTINKNLTTGMNNRLLVLTPKSKAGIRTITIDDKTIDTLKKWKAEQAQLLLGFGFNAMKKDQLVFSRVDTNTHMALTAPRNKLVRFCEKHNLEMVNVHGFRHTHCSLLFDAGVSIKDVKERLGHEDIQTTMNIYTHVTDESKKNTAELFSKYANF